MGIKKIKEIIKLIENKLDYEEQKQLINEIKNNTDLKLETALIIEIKNQKKELLRNKLKQLNKKMDSYEPSNILSRISKQAAFASHKIVESEDLPITDETIADFLSDEED